MKKIIILALMFVVTNSQAQITKATLQASGLTCSMCSKSIHKSLSTIDAVKSITPELNTNSFIIEFKDSAAVSIDELKQKVEKAGYKVAALKLDATVKNQTVKNDTHITVDGVNYHFVGVKEQTIDGAINFNIIDKGFVAAKTFKKYSKLTKMSCYQTGYMQSCCTKSGGLGERIYHVTL